MPSPSIYYSPEYNLGLSGIEQLHPFDTGKSGWALERLRSQIGTDVVDAHLVQVVHEASEVELRLAHSKAYLESLSTSAEIANILEFPILQRLPWAMVNEKVLRPMRLAVRGTIDAAQAALSGGLAVNLSGGFHHACHDRGGGFCIYSDVVVAIRSLQQRALLKERDPILYIDVDAHQANGVERLCMHYRLGSVFILDMYCAGIYPDDGVAAARIDLSAALPLGASDHFYLDTLEQLLPRAIATAGPALAIYNAGTDILTGDPLGGLDVSAAGVTARDRFVIESCRASGIPLLIVPSGGYTPESHRLIADMLRLILPPATSSVTATS